MKIEKYDVAIIGAGPAGMMAAFQAASSGASVILLEKNNFPGIKLLMTGKERCNITNAETDIRKFTDKFGKNGKFLKNALYRFGVNETLNFFHKNKINTKVERGNRIFPESNKAKDIQNLFINLISRKNIKLNTECNIKNFITKSNKIEKIILSDIEIKADSFIIATGGLSYPKTGSTGDGYKWAKEMGHNVIQPSPALTPIVVEESWVNELDKLKIKNIQISVFQNNRKQDSRFGEAEFTTYGLNGPIILDISKSVGNLLKQGKVNLYIDFKPRLEFDVLDKRILRDFNKYSDKPIKIVLQELLPRQIIPIIIKLANLNPDKKVNSISKDERKKVRMLLKCLPLTPVKLLGFNKAVITSGGIDLKEIDPKTMRSKIIDNLYFTGEILDLDGPTGGYNLQVCWSTGYLAGQNAAIKSKI
ncbi:MAG TPA: NAD(P)/FAD-dependent oxidoreductase [Victivallales bacterium]|nr:NAD(P)/FAD-dependent oxidoreductase [Victivallales bacterium]